MGPAHLTLVAVLSAWPIPSTPREPTVPAAAPAGSAVTPAPPAAPPIPAPPAEDFRPPPAPTLERSAPTAAPDVAAEGTELAVRASPPPAPAKPRQPLYKKWWFWTIAGGLFTSVVTITYVETRPPPTPYHGSTSNGVNVITFP